MCVCCDLFVCLRYHYRILLLLLSGIARDAAPSVAVQRLVCLCLSTVAAWVCWQFVCVVFVVISSSIAGW